MATIAEIAEEIDRRAHSYSIGNLQEVRRQIKGLSRLASHRIFAPQTVFENWAFHFGGRTELQFNIGFETVDDIKCLRHGVAFSLELSQTLPDIAPLVPKIARFNEYLRLLPDDLSDFKMWRHEQQTRSTMRPGPIWADIVRPKVFVFLGDLGPVDSLDYDRILADFDRLLPLYRYVEGQASFPELVDPGVPFRFEPGCSVKPSGARVSLGERELDVQLRHNDLQLALYEHLVDKYGPAAVGAERGTGTGSRLDVVVQSSDGLAFYEIKTSSSARACIREALAQLLEYSLWPGATEANSLVVVGEPVLDSDAREFLERLRRKFGMPIRYQQFDFRARALRD